MGGLAKSEEATQPKDTKSVTSVEHPCKFCGKPVEVEAWEAEAASKDEYLVTCDDAPCHRAGFAHLGWGI